MGNSSSTCLYNCLDGECPHKYYKKRNSDTKQQVPSHCIQPASQQISGKGFLAVKMYNNSASTGGGGGDPTENHLQELAILLQQAKAAHAPCCDLGRWLSPHLVKAAAKPKGSIFLLLLSHPVGTGAVGVKDSALQWVILNHTILSASPRLSNQTCEKMTTLYITERQKMSWLQQMGPQMWHLLHETGEFSPKASPFCYKQEAENHPQTPALL